MRSLKNSWLLVLFGLAACGSDATGGSSILKDADSLDAGVTEVTVVTPDLKSDTADWGEPEEVEVSGPEVAPACEPGSDCFMAPCEDGSDCPSGLCVQHMGDSVCTITCVEECPEGWNCKQVSSEPDVIFACISPYTHLCRPCVDTADCASATGVEDACIPLGPLGSFCGADCGEEGECPAGYSCTDTVSVDGTPVTQCQPDEGVCECSETSKKLALKTDCKVESEWGSCDGMRFCGPEGLTECDAQEPVPEECNGLDDDCDGDVDDVSCDDGNPCTDDTCDPDTGCMHENNSEPCDDADPCTLADVCVDGVCSAGEPWSCDDGNGCTNDSCSAAQGCVHEANDGLCDDGSACTTGDHCEDGMCVSAGMLDCDDGNPCTVDSCAPENGCSYSDGDFACNDTNPCTLNDYCVDGQCVSGPLPDCDDGNPCTEDACEAGGQCTHTPVAGDCDDGNLCTVGATCVDGACVPSGPANCDDGNICTTDTCDPFAGCQHEQNTVPCSDGNNCTFDEACSGGVCLGGKAVNCNDGNLCTDDACEPALGCVYVDNTVPCSDGNACTTFDKCSGGECNGIGALNCDDSNLCTDDSCDPAAGCIHVNNSLPCDDNNTCTIEDGCTNGACVGSGSLECDDKNPCTKDVCLPGGGCQNQPIAGACSDGDACTTSDECVNGACEPGPQVDCDDGNVCTDDSCGPGGVCAHAPNAGGCDDGNECTVGDHCEGGVCALGGALECDDGNVCTTDGCNPLTGCTHSPNDLLCDDGDACTGLDQCSGGACEPGPAVDCDDGKECTTDSCAPLAGCANAPLDEGAVVGVCRECDDAGNEVKPEDDEGCGIILCSELDYYYTSGPASPSGINSCRLREYSAIETDRCEALGDCKDENSGDCAEFDDIVVATCGVCCFAEGPCQECTNYGADVQGPTTDYYYDDGPDAPDGINSCVFRDYQCTGDSCEEVFEETVTATCGVCTYCDGEECAQYEEGTPCAEGSACYDGECLYDSYTVLLLHGDDEAIMDSSKSEHQTTAHGGAHSSANQSKFGGASIRINSWSDYVSIPTSPDFFFADEDFTIDMWIYKTSQGQYDGYLLSQIGNGWLHLMGGNYAGLGLHIYMDGEYKVRANASFTFQLNTWYHLAYVREGDKQWVFINGVSQPLWNNKVVEITHQLTGDLEVGRYPAIGGHGYNGYIDELRISKGIARWTSNFVPPNVPYGPNE